MAIVSNKDKAEFAAYLRQCTDRQVIGVWQKEHDARRRQYEALAYNEAARRGIEYEIAA